MEDFLRMEWYHLFPYSLVEKNAEIILYGYGFIGKQYVEQLLKNHYCRIKYVADRSWSTANASVRVVSPEHIREEKDPIVVIATLRYADEVRKWLLEAGVPEKNIIFQNIEIEARYIRKTKLTGEKSNFLEAFRKYLTIRDVTSETPLVRIGRDYDGGYLMLDDFKHNGIAYSFGISSDVSWDKDMAERGYDIFMYDHTINGLPEKNPRFHWFPKGLADTAEHESNLYTLEELIEENGHEGDSNMILKMDVEGAEWGGLNMADSKALMQFDQIVLELHGIMGFERMDEMLSALGKLSKTHQCVHVHANNYSYQGYIGEVPIADSMEVTFVNRESCHFFSYGHACPHSLDMPCNPDHPEINLGMNYSARE